jgi:hypothetical protein
VNARVRQSLIDGRRQEDAVLLCGCERGHLLIDPPGSFLISYTRDTATLSAHARETGAPIFVNEADATPDLLAALENAGLRFLTTARPIRGEPWRAIAGTRAPRLYTNRAGPALAVPSELTTERAIAAWQAFTARPLPGRPADVALDDAASLAAALSLATIAWELWRNREPTDPLLALERFGDLDATVQFADHHVRVRLPLGKRYRDLKHAGLLEDVPRVPWLSERTVIFAGG